MTRAGRELAVLVSIHIKCSIYKVVYGILGYHLYWFVIMALAITNLDCSRSGL